MKHKLLQTWTRKSAKLLAAFALLATTSFSAKADYTCLFGKSYNSGNAGTYENNWYTTNDGFRCDLTNWNNNNTSANSKNNWTYVKCGSRNAAYTATITTHDAISENIQSVSVTIDAITVNSITSIKLYTSVDGTEYTEAGSFARAVGDQTVSLTNSNANSFYKIEFVCQKGSSNGLAQVSKVVYKTGTVDPNKPAAPTFTPDGGEVDANSTVTIAGDDKTLSLKYWFGDDETAATTVTGSTATVTITEACTLNAVAIGEGDVESVVKTASYTLTPAINTYKQITTELTSGKYVFMCGENFVNPVLVSNRCNFTDDFTKTEDQIVASEKYEFTITVDGEYATIQGVDGKYLGINAAGNNYFTQGTDASTNNFKWKFTVDNGVVTFTSAIADTNVLAQHMGNNNELYTNFAPGKVEGSVYPTLYKLYVAPEAPELPAPTAAENVTITEGEGSWTIRPESYPVVLTFAVEDGVQMYAKSISDTQAQAAAEGDNDGYTVLEGNTLTLTAQGDNYSVYAMKDGVKSVAKTIVADAATSIAGIEAENGEAVYFNLQGVRVQNPENGVFIRVQNGKAVKIVK